jgi:hypothetical protein
MRLRLNDIFTEFCHSSKSILFYTEYVYIYQQELIIIHHPDPHSFHRSSKILLKANWL